MPPLGFPPVPAIQPEANTGITENLFIFIIQTFSSCRFQKSVVYYKKNDKEVIL